MFGVIAPLLYDSLRIMYASRKGRCLVQSFTMKKPREKWNNQRIALLGILGAQALAVSFLEGLLPALPFLPPGAKPGFSNIITMFTASALGWREALVITLIKAMFAALRGATAFAMSLGGGLVSTLLLCLLLQWKKCPFSIIGISILCALGHNLGQLSVAILLTGTPAMAGFLPLLLLFALAAGLLTGFLLAALMPALQRQKRYFLRQ